MCDSHRHGVIPAALCALKNRLCVLSRNCEVNPLASAVDDRIVALQDIQTDDSIHCHAMASVAEPGLKIAKIDQSYWPGAEVITSNVQAVDHCHWNDPVIDLDLFRHLNDTGTL